MHKRNRLFTQKKRSKPLRTPWEPTPRAATLGLIGFPLLVLGLGDVAARLHSQVSQGAEGAILRLAYGFECIIAGVTIVVGGMLLLDYMERWEGD